MDDKEGKWKFVSTEKKKKKKPQEKEIIATNTKNSKKNLKTGKSNKKTKPEKQYAVPGNVAEDVYIPPNKLKLLEQEKREQELKKKLKEKEKKKKSRARNNENQNQDLLSVDEIIEEIVIEDYKQWLNQLKSEFKKNHDARLKKFADYFINKFSKCGTEIYFDEFAKPLYLIDEKINELTFEYLKDIKQEEAVEFYWFLVDLLVNPQKSLNKVGVMLVLQYTANQWGEEILKTFDFHVEKYMEPKKKKDWKDVDRNLPALLWSIIQTGKCTSGIISIWSKYFLPLLGKSDSFDVKNMVIRFVEHLVSQPNFETSIDYVSFPPNYKLLASSFEGLMLAMVSGVLDENFTQRLNHIYLPIRKAIFEDENLKKSNFFEMLLIHAASKFQVFRNEALICLNKCLTTDRDCFDIWRRIYSENLAQSNNLLVYTRNNWGTPKLKIEDEALFSLLGHFTGINKKIDYGEWKFETKMTEEEEIKTRRMALICNDSIIKLKKVMSTGKLFMILGFVLLLLLLSSIYFYFNPLQS